MNIAEKEALVESLHQRYVQILADTRGNPFHDVWDYINIKDEDTISDEDTEMIDRWFEPIMSLS